MKETSVDIQARVADLERRVGLLENGLYGHAAPECGPSLLARCYLEAHRAAREVDPETASAWIAQAYLLDVRALVTLGRLVSDPFPFRPFLAVLDACIRLELKEAPKALAHLESVSRDLLRIQGLELLDPRDTMRHLQLEEAIRRLRQNLPK